MKMSDVEKEVSAVFGGTIFIQAGVHRRLE